MIQFPARLMFKALLSQGMGCKGISWLRFGRILISLLCAAVVLLSGSYAQAQVEYVQASYCMNDEYFHFIFDVFTTTDANNVIVWASPDDNLFYSKNEEITISFNPHTGDVTRGPLVETVGSPAKDRWMDGDITTFSISQTDDGIWRIEGDVLSGKDPLAYGSTILETRMRDFEGADNFQSNVKVGLCAACIPKPCRILWVFPCAAIEIGLIGVLILGGAIYLGRQRARAR